MFSQNRTSRIINVLSYIFIALNLLAVPIFLDKNLNNSYIIPKQYVFGGLVLINALLWMTKFVLTKKFQFTKTMLDKPIVATLVAAFVSSAFSVDI